MLRMNKRCILLLSITDNIKFNIFDYCVENVWPVCTDFPYQWNSSRLRNWVITSINGHLHLYSILCFQHWLGIHKLRGRFMHPSNAHIIFPALKYVGWIIPLSQDKEPEESKESRGFNINPAVPTIRWIFHFKDCIFSPESPIGCFSFFPFLSSLCFCCSFNPWAYFKKCFYILVWW